MSSTPAFRHPSFLSFSLRLSRFYEGKGYANQQQQQTIDDHHPLRGIFNLLHINIIILSTTKIENIAKMAATLPESEDDVPMLDEEREINSSIAPLADEHTISTTTDSAILADNVATATNKKPFTTASGVPPGELFVASPPHITLGCKVVFNCLLTLRVLDTRLFRVKFFKKIFNNNDRA
ncbi:uncharacterized protein LOC142235205 [Haematobia irritans]|uniref:uncharacterized protein LOC142235205 n=1 Tax=Haematobia irritans TaxID=7368 RepID=UPI003F505705